MVKLQQLSAVEIKSLVANLQNGSQLHLILEAGNAKNPFSDVEGHYVDAVKALVENEVTLGKTATVFGTHDNATRGQFALFVYRAANMHLQNLQLKA